MTEITIEKILEIINSTIENSEITAVQSDEDLQQFGMDSLTFVRIVVLMEEEFDLEIPDSYLIVSEMNTVAKILNVLKSIKA